MNQLKVVMLGDSLYHQGGIVTVEKLILDQVPPDVQIQHISTREDGPVVRKLVVFGQAVGDLLWRLLRRKADIVHIHLAERGSAFRKAIVTLVALVFSRPVIMHAHGPEFPSFYANLPQPVKQGLNWVFCRCTRFIVLSESWKDFYVSSLGLKTERVIVLPNPIKLPSQIPHRTNSSKVNLIFLGRIGQRKGTFDLIQAFANLSSNHKACSQLTIAGDGDVEQAHRLVGSLSLTDSVTILNWLDPDQRDALLAKADVFALPSYSEGLPMALLEAMSWGLPVITTPVGGIPELVTQDQNGLLVNPGDVQQLSKAMQVLIEDKSLRFSLGSAARLSVTSLDVTNYRYSLGCIYRSVLGFKEVALEKHS